MFENKSRVKHDPGCEKRSQEIYILLNSRRTKNDAREQLTTLPNPRDGLAIFCSIKYDCWTLPFFDIRILRKSFACPVKTELKGVFSRQRERFAKDANDEKMAKSNVRILCSKSSPNMRAGFGNAVNCSRDARNRIRTPTPWTTSPRITTSRLITRQDNYPLGQLPYIGQVPPRTTTPRANYPLG